VDDVVSAFPVIDDNRVEEVLVSTSDILGSDKLQRDSEGLEVGGIRGDLSIREEDIETESRSARRAFFGTLLFGGRSHRGDGRSLVAVCHPVPEGARAQSESLAEALLCQLGMLLLQAEIGAHDQRSDRGFSQRDVSQDGGRHAEQRVQKSVVLKREIFLPLSGRSPDVGQDVECALKRSHGPRAQAAQALRIYILAARGLLELDGDPPGPSPVDHGETDENEQDTWV
jgi:hypothetical protein